VAAGAEVPDNLITVMIRNRSHYERWGSHVYGREASLFIGASIGSTTNAVCSAFVEIERWLEQHAEHADLRLDERFLLSSLDEAVRISGSVWLTRVAMRDTTLPSGKRVGRGQVMWLNLHASYASALGAGAFSVRPAAPTTASLRRSRSRVRRGPPRLPRQDHDPGTGRYGRGRTAGHGRDDPA
jgi:hypothetical protein